ncbi:GGDEF domain-containing protein [Planosporangium thailandense]|uniref:GGDEF domain-containing protein n=1 Tax=Planosporangium thailandense TaxID=765197 RepID=UPI0030B83D30
MAVGVGSAAELEHVRNLLLAGRCAEAGGILQPILATSTGPDLADALAEQLVVLINLRRGDEYSATMDAAFEAARAYPEPARVGLLHAFAALVGLHSGSLETCVWHLVLSARTLNAVELTDAGIVRAWHDLALAYSYAGFHGHALGALARARTIGAGLGMPPGFFAAPDIRVRHAVSLDQFGDTEGCSRILRDVVQDLRLRRLGGELGLLRPVSLRAYGYAIARLAALGRHGPMLDSDPRPLLQAADDSGTAHDLAVLGAVCLAIAEHRPIEALARLETAEVADETLGAAEGHRLRALAYVAAGDLAAAYDADRQACRIAGASNEKLRDLFVEGMAARVDHDELRRRADWYAGAASTDPLTGLPNRWALEHYVNQLMAKGESLVLGVCDLDGFKAVNTVHGHLSGDLVLQRVAAVLSRVMRRDDFVARYGGDEFVVVLATTSQEEASEIARRIVTAVSCEDWESLVPGTPVSVTIGWAGISEEGPITTVAEAFVAADHEMLKAKEMPRAC